MDLVSRLKLFLSENNIAVTQFADTCGIPRPTVSQIINGRNKKISDEIISKIHIAYPHLSVYWLMFGEGDMINGGNSSDGDKATPESTQLEGNIFSQLPDYRQIFNPNKGKSDTKSPNTAGNQTTTHQTAIKSPVSKDDISVNEKLHSDAGERTISRIVVFYTDNSFESFSPNASIL